ncbi:HsdM family class I SAM-dependent methyltransferase [Prevotella sp.]|uniref:HsdM family class I SAM-dependent methyltransferase n=1 Tax=Prevotella sp. TaxID=59823 RepID=UPI00307B4D4B
MAKITKSIEEKIEDWCKKQFKGQKYYTKTEAINPEIEIALNKAPSKQGGSGKNYPDIKCLLFSENGRKIPVMIEVKGKKGDLIKVNAKGEIDNTKKDSDPNYQNIAKYAVNGAIHYANAILNFTDSYKEVVAIGVNGYEESGKTIHEVDVWYISKDNLFVPKHVGSYEDVSFLLEKNTKEFIEKLDTLALTSEELEERKLALEDEIERKLKALNQSLHDEQQIVVNNRVQLVAGLIMAGLGAEGVQPLRIEDLKSIDDKENNDGQVIMSKIRMYLKHKKLPKEKIDMILGILDVVFLNSGLEKPTSGGESKLHTIYADVKRDILPYVTGELHNIDFTGRLFNVMNEWVDVPDGGENDVVLTPRYVTELMAKMCEVNMNSYVWDFATGSAGFLISAMHQMIDDAKQKYAKSPIKFEEKVNQIKMEQLLGIEKLPDVYMLAVLNMILMKDGSTNIIQKDSLTFEGNYEQGENINHPFPANVFLLNPPYSADGKGFVFVEKALGMMTHGGRAAVLIQENAGSGNGLPFTANILRNNTLRASIKMADIFCGKANVQTAIYVFEVNRPHDAENDLVRFIDFSNDGYTRMNRKKSGQSVNLRDTDNAKERYAEVANLVRYGKGADNKNLNYFKDCYTEDYITLNGNDWTYGQHQKIDTIPTEEDFQTVVKEYLSWKVGQVLKGESGLGKK